MAVIFIIAVNTSSGMDEDLNWNDTSRCMENLIDLYLSKTDVWSIHEITGNRVFFKRRLAVINDDSVTDCDIHTRGKTTLHLRRKSFSVDANEPVPLFFREDTIRLKKFYAISMSMDDHYFRNRISFGMLKELGMFELFFAYARIRINGEEEGIYLVLERPQDWALNKYRSPCIIRRGFKNRIDRLRTGKNTDKVEVKNTRRQFMSMYKSLNKYEGIELYEVLSEWIDLEMYMRWLAFNFLVRNGDYTDEVYFYLDPGSDNFRIIPWDYDDIFASQPHEGTEVKMHTIGSKLIYSSEDKLDQAIAQDPYLYDLYLKQLYAVAKELEFSTIKEIVEAAYSELYPYYMNENIMKLSAFDEQGSVTLQSLRSDMSGLYKKINSRREEILKFLNESYGYSTH